MDMTPIIKGRYIENQMNDYARQFGKDALLKDFAQPYVGEKPNPVYWEAYPEQIPNVYTIPEIIKYKMPHTREQLIQKEQREARVVQAELEKKQSREDKWFGLTYHTPYTFRPVRDEMIIEVFTGINQQGIITVMEDRTNALTARVRGVTQECRDELGLNVRENDIVLVKNHRFYDRFYTPKGLVYIAAWSDILAVLRP